MSRYSDSRARKAAEIMFTVVFFAVYGGGILGLISGAFIWLAWSLPETGIGVLLWGLSLVIGVLFGGTMGLLAKAKEVQNEVETRYLERKNRVEKITAQEGMLTEVIDNGEQAGALTMATYAVAGDLEMTENE